MLTPLNDNNRYLIAIAIAIVVELSIDSPTSFLWLLLRGSANSIGYPGFVVDVGVYRLEQNQPQPFVVWCSIDLGLARSERHWLYSVMTGL